MIHSWSSSGLASWILGQMQTLLMSSIQNEVQSTHLIIESMILSCTHLLTHLFIHLFFSLRQTHELRSRSTIRCSTIQPRLMFWVCMFLNYTNMCGSCQSAIAKAGLLGTTGVRVHSIIVFPAMPSAFDGSPAEDYCHLCSQIGRNGRLLSSIDQSRSSYASVCIPDVVGWVKKYKYRSRNHYKTDIMGSSKDFSPVFKLFRFLLVICDSIWLVC